MPTEARFAGPLAAENAESSTSATTAAATTAVPTAVPTTTTTATSHVADTSSKYSEEHIKTLTNLGMSRQEAINALEMSGGNIDLAASLLF
ncbi:uncharacterized protein BX664DRAFT_67302 [Halteromyces radiatus]|uniref:uncharacterized protein n=1 Tax=Halteromyces radiatus TaxID=101107 RepID=UPI00221FF9C8|nr:uncharacterized protein BX664DRAFT_67302 [Halteromyces radiatus]KAI8096831.1 hypothetical protein BX664DRAFT_67302 [Halteromyces radiatus]